MDGLPQATRAAALAARAATWLRDEEATRGRAAAVESSRIQVKAAPLRGTASGAPRAGLWPWGGPARRARAGLGRVPWIFEAGSCRPVRCLTD